MIKDTLNRWVDAAGNIMETGDIVAGIKCWKTVQKVLFPGEKYIKSRIDLMESMHEKGIDKERIEEVSEQLQAYCFGSNTIEQYREHINSSSTVQKFKRGIKKIMGMEDASDEEVLEKFGGDKNEE